MTEKTTKCEKPEFLKTVPGECTPEQIEKCHGSAKNHPCSPADGKK